MGQQFAFDAGRGVLRTKVTPDRVIRFGRVALPTFGQCAISGNHGKSAKRMMLDIQQIATRDSVAKLDLPATGTDVRFGTITTKDGRTWSVEAVFRRSTKNDGTYLVLRMPDVAASY